MVTLATKYTATIVHLLAEHIGTKATGTAEFTVHGAQLRITIQMLHTPANVQTWTHFTGFPDGKPATIATAAQDANGHGFVHLPTTTPVSGTTMVPLHAEPAKMHVPKHSYPVADAHGHYA